MTKRYIDANALQAQLERKKVGIANQRYTEGWNDCMMRVKSMVSKAPTADVAPVVRCKDCKHYDMGVCLKIYSDGSVHPAAWQPRRPEDFCSYGERKDDKHEH